uniref:HD domain-containing protein n=1 Tax=Eubacterium plexicaudatum ASF492 TaxID=1235802 RepID=N2AGL2_9FIRM
MITIGVVLSNAYVDYSAHIIRGLCRRAKEREGVNLIFFPGVLGSDLKSSEENEKAEFYGDAVALVDVLIVSDQEMLQMLLDQPEGALFSNVLEHVPYLLLKDDAGQVFERACALAEGQPTDEQHAVEEDEADLFAENGQTKGQRRDRFERALEFALKAHKGQVRKGSSVPYIFHPIETALITMTLTRDQDIIIAALFHDVIEDTRYSAKEIEDAFGSRVAHLVQMESENKRKGQDASETWKIRKQEFIDGLERKSKDEKVIALADKLSNMRATRQGYLKNDERFWERFHQKDKNMHGWYYRAVADRLREFEDTDAWKELNRLIGEVFDM